MGNQLVRNHDDELIRELKTRAGRKDRRANPGGQAFFDRVIAEGQPVYLSAVTIGELRCGIDIIRHRGDSDQAARLDDWLEQLIDAHGEAILDLGQQEARIPRRLRLPHPECAGQADCRHHAQLWSDAGHPNTRDFERLGLEIVNPFI